MRDATDIVKVIKKIAVDAVIAGKPTSIFYGRVLAASPLRINVEQKLTLTKEQLILTKQVSDYNFDMTVDGTRKTYRMHNRLVAGDEVMLLQVQGGQQFIVLDRVST